MHSHPNARLTALGRAQVFAAVEAGMTVSAAALVDYVSSARSSCCLFIVERPLMPRSAASLRS